MNRIGVNILIVLCSLSFTIMNACGQTSNKDEANVLPPWTSIVLSGNQDKLTVTCWGRKYFFDHSILPTQITSQGEPLLSSPIEIGMINSRQAIQWKDGTISVTSKDNAHVDLEGQIASTGNNSGILVKSKIHIEYDGLMEISLTFEGNQTNPLSIKIPYKRGNALYYLKWIQNRHQIYSGGIPDNRGILMESAYTPYFWIGNNNYGLFWFRDNSKGWPDASKRSAIQLKSTPTGVLQQFNIGVVNSYDFNLQATPVKPMLNEWRRWRLSSTKSANIMILWTNPDNPASTKYYGWPEASNPDIYKKRIRNYHAQGKKVIAYASVSRIPSLSPFYQENKKKWANGKIRMKVKNDELVYIDPTSATYQDVIAEQFTHYMKEYGLDGYYLDGGGLYPYWQNASGRTYYPILGYRSLQKKLYAALKAANPNAIIVTHMSADMDIPVLAYTDAYVDGEQFRYSKNGQFAYKAEDSYSNIISLDQFKAEFIGKQWGIIPFFLPEVSPDARKTEQPTKGLAALLLIHDVQPWPTNSNISVWDSMYQALDMFDITNSTFLPYYDSVPPATTTMNRVYVSAYKKDSQLLLVVANLSNMDQKGDIMLNLKKIGITSVNSIIELPTETNVNYNGSNIPTAIEPMSYKLFWIK